MNDFIRDNVRLQPNRYSCGPAALRNALLAYGERHSVRKIIGLALADHQGADEAQLALAAAALGYDIVHEKFTAVDPARAAIRGYIDDGIPIIAIVDTWSHWVTVLDADGRHVTIADSARPGPVLRVITWRQFFHRLAAWTDGVRFDIYPVVR